MGSSRLRNSTRAGKARSANRSTPSRHRTAGQPRSQTTTRIPPAIEIAIDAQQEAIGVAITLLYCLHLALRRQIEGDESDENEAVEAAARGAAPTHISSMLLVRLNAVYLALDSVELGQADIDPERLALIEAMEQGREP